MASRQNHGESPALQESKEFECPVCLQILERPVRTQCGHIFCECCHHINFTTNGGKCPLCRGVTSHKEPFATDIETKLRSTKAKCQDCGCEMYLIFMRKHMKVCSKVLEDLNQLANTCAQPTARHATPRSTEMLPTYSCPYCHARDYDEISLIQHCQTVHYLDHQRVVCPICTSMPWGDPNYQSRNFIHHLSLRHQFNYDSFVDYNQDEETMLQSAIFNSFHGFFRIQNQ
ncbi:E3 ubiquitin-protein ligase RNF138 isoform X2 [Hemitrygon akajei]|uniref:E3 ubiquitin-protein ligase RNF138 isoform X2 n=1 Tax=Hemitrygon akajei TaxID=2704970 RepID=UPI003BF9A5A8